MGKMKNKVLIIVPAYNEEGKIGKVLREIKNYASSILVVDDGSSDRTYTEAKAEGVKVIRHNKNLGIGRVYMDAIRYALENKYDTCLHIAADMQDDPKDIPRFISKIEEGYDYVQGSRYMVGGKRVNHPVFRTLTTFIYSLFFSLIVGRRVTDGSNGYRAYRTDIFKNGRIDLWKNWLDRYELEPYMYYHVIKRGFRWGELGVKKMYPRDRMVGYTKMRPFIDWWRIVKPLIYLKLGLRK